MNKKPYIDYPQHGLPRRLWKAVQQDRRLQKPMVFTASGRAATTAIPYEELEVADGNYDTTRGAITTVVLHTMVGTVSSAASRFDTPNAGVSAHYGVGLDGKLYHWLEEYWTAYHAGNYAINQTSIGIEHEDGGNYNSPRPDALYATSAKLVRDICQYYGIPIDRSHIRKHSEVSQLGTACPDALDVERIVREAAGTPNPAPTIDFAAIGKEAKPFVFGYQTQGTLTQRMTKIIAVYKKHGVSS